MIIDVILLIITFIAGIVEPVTKEGEILTFVVLGTGLIIEFARLTVWSIRENEKVDEHNRKVFREIYERERRKYEGL